MGIFSGKLKIKDVFEKAASAIGASVFTNQERAEFNKSLADSQLEFVKQTVSENSARSITRRYIAVSIIGVYLMLVIASGASYLFHEEYSKHIFELANESLGTLVIMVCAFYFGGYYLSQYNKKPKK